MSLKSYIFILFVITITSIGSILLLLFYMNPLAVESQKIAFSMMGIAIFLSTSSFLSPIIFFIKKIYYRGDVSISTMNSSVRQAILITVGIISMIVLYFFRIFEPRLITMIWFAILCLEVMMQVIE